jgi:hypothetical protein
MLAKRMVENSHKKEMKTKKKPVKITDAVAGRIYSITKRRLKQWKKNS